jgi:hypothetical protein
MHRAKIAFLGLCVVLNTAVSFHCPGQYEADKDPAYVPVLSLENSPYKIFTVLNEIGRSTLFIFAADGEPLFFRKLDSPCYDFKLLPDGTLSYYCQEEAGFVILDSLFEEVRIIKPVGGSIADFHEIQITGNGDYFLFGNKNREVDMSGIVEGGYENAQVTDMIIQKLDPENNLLFEWNSAEHFEISDSYVNLLTHVIDYVHFNALEMDSDSSIIVSSRNLRELTKIDLNSGDIIWRMGGKNNQFTFRNFDRQFSGQHSIRRKNGKIFTIFDNGWGLDPKFSKGSEFTIDEDSLIVEEIRSFRHDPDIYTDILGNLQNLDNGNTLIFWGSNELHETGGKFTEYDVSGFIVHEGKFIHCTGPSYRVKKYRWENKIFEAEKNILEFPPTPVGDSAVLSLVLKNHTRDVLHINHIVANHPNFYLEEDSFYIYPQGEYQLELIFKPGTDSVYTDKITFGTYAENQGIALQIALSGKGAWSNKIEAVSAPVIFDLFPVPFGRMLQYTLLKLADKISLVSSSGRLVWNEYQPSSSGIINTAHLPADIYVVRVLFKDGSMRHRKIIKK